MSHISNVNQSQPLSQISTQSAPKTAEPISYSSPPKPEKVNARHARLQKLPEAKRQTPSEPAVLSEANKMGGDLSKIGAVLDQKPTVVNSKGPTLGEKTTHVLRKMVGAGALAGTYLGFVARGLIQDALKNQSLFEMGIGLLTGIIALPFRILFAVPVYLQQKGYGV